MMKTLATVFIALLLIGTGSLAGAAENTVVLVNSGSTNTPGCHIMVWPDGRAESTVTHRDASSTEKPTPGHVSAVLTHQLYRDLKRLMPLSQYPHPGCMKSISFGYSESIQYHGQESPDLTCPVDPRLAPLVDDAQAIAKALHVEF